jgi:hypothetical protein
LWVFTNSDHDYYARRMLLGRFCCYAWFALLQSRHSTGWKLQHCHFRSLSWLECRHDSAIEMKRHVGKGG